jgi:hypothetical protein
MDQRQIAGKPAGEAGLGQMLSKNIKGIGCPDRIDFQQRHASLGPDQDVLQRPRTELAIHQQSPAIGQSFGHESARCCRQGLRFCWMIAAILLGQRHVWTQ